MAKFKYPNNYDDDFINTFKEVLDYLNEMGYTYKESLQKAQDILEEAQQTNDMNESVQQQINTLIAESGTSDAEVLQARIDAEGNEYTVLKDRLDEKEQNFSAQLADTSKKFKSSLIDNINKLGINTFDGSDEPYHPSVVYFPEGWNGFKFWLSYTPFPESAKPYRDRWECPSIVASNDGLSWQLPEGAPDPLVDLTSEEVSRGDYFSDPSIVMNGGKMEIWYRKTNGANLSQTDIYRITSTNGIDWSNPEIVHDTQRSNNGLNTIMRSQQIFLMDYGYRSYWVDGPSGRGNSRNIVFADSDNPSTGVWKNFTTCNMIDTPKDYNPWHVGVYLDNGTYHMTVYDLSRKSVDYFVSTNGEDFDFVKTILSPTSFVTDWYQTYPLKVGNEWYVYASWTKNEKHGLSLFVGDTIDNLIGISGMEVDNENLASFFYGDHTELKPTGLGQFIKSNVVPKIFYSRLKDGDYVWDDIYKPTNSVEKKTVNADNAIDVDGTDILIISGATKTTISELLTATDGQELTIINNMADSITLERGTSRNQIRTKSKNDYVLESGVAIKLVASTDGTNSTIRWYEI